MQNHLQSRTGPVDSRASKHARLYTLPFAAAQITGGFWADQQESNRRISLHHGYEQLHKAGNFHNLRLAAGLATVEGDGPYRGRNFYDEDLYKWLEALGWELGRTPEVDVPELRAMAEEAIALIQAAQEPDGYLDSWFQVVEPDRKWADLDHGHEMYCAGHLFQAAVAFHRALDDDRLLDVAVRLADHIDERFGPGKREGACGHPEIETALVELYRVTREPRYLALSQVLVDRRGRNLMVGWDGLGPRYQQDHVPVREAQGVDGHAVRQVYLESGIADLYLESGEEALLASMKRLWEDMTERKLYITGGIGSRFQGESFGDPYVLPSDTCYCETCAAIGSFQWNWRMLLITGDGQYAALMEQTLYNGILASRGLDNRHFFYANPLQLRGGGEMHLSSNPEDGVAVVAGRPAWHYVACCPPNIMRLLASLASYLATQNENGVQIHQYATANLRFDVAGAPVSMAIESDYPWQGNVDLRIVESGDAPWTLALRLPAWANAHLVHVNDALIDAPLRNGYLLIERTWQPGDVVRLEIPMKPRFVHPHPRIDAIRGCVAVQNGPLVYALEAVDLPPTVTLEDVALDEETPLQVAWRDGLLGDVAVIRAQGASINTKPWRGIPYASAILTKVAGGEAVPLTLVPYFRWGNRGMDGMRVWIPRLSLYKD